jgi:hypothetical protein
LKTIERGTALAIATIAGTKRRSPRAGYILS